jgi:cell division protein FtsQ
MKKKMLVLACAILLSIATWVVGAWASKQPTDAVCQRLEILLCDSAQHQFVSVDELQRTLQRRALLPMGKRWDEVSCQEIEQCLLQHDMIRTAECYKKSTGDVCVRLTQRVPMLYVTTAEGSYYVDTDRKIMPVRSSIQVAVPIFKGNISQRAATEEYFDFVSWLMNDNYWRQRITQIHVRNPKQHVLTQLHVEGNILLGDLNGYEQKMERLRKLYVKGFDKIGYKSYKEYDLRYQGQVVGRY